MELVIAFLLLLIVLAIPAARHLLAGALAIGTWIVLIVVVLGVVLIGALMLSA